MSSLGSEAYDFTLEVPEIDGALLMELLEEANLEQDHLECVLESEFESNYHLTDANCDDCELDRVLSDLDSHECSESSMSAYMMDLKDPFELAEMDVVSDLTGEDMGAWYIDTVEMDVYEGGSWYDDFYFGESSTEQMYIPLW